MSDKPIIKEYSNDDLTVVWKPKTCIHSEKCWRGLASVFNPKGRPWIDVSGASSEVIAKQVEACPSGALTYYLNNTQETNMENAQVIEVKVAGGGPLLVAGEVKIIHKDGTEEVRKNCALCRCGHSANKPFCDGAHKTSDFDA
ncbi:MAG: (4Fe-4S)-binding protein [Bacteroidia bacterium]